ncbi:MAG: acyltransferase [Woeseiaceae bacterium]|nr:acyltransferase [Woeseiaceae bacterium]
MLTNLKGALVFAAATVNTIVWFTPLIGFTLLKLVIPIRAFRRLMTRWIMAMGENWISVNAFVFGRVNGTHYELEGFDGLSRDRWYVLVVNHQTWVDIIALQTAFNRRIPFLKFFVKQQLLWFPVLGIAFWAMDMPFMKRYSKAYLAKHPEKKGTDLEQTRRACRKFNATPTSVINFVEGTRFSEAKRERRESPYRYLLPPRAGGIAVTLSAMGDLFDALLDVTIHYPDGVPTFWDAMCGRFRAVRIEVRQRRLQPWLLEGDYIDDRDHRRRFHRWLADLWREKDAILQRLNQPSIPAQDADAQPARKESGQTHGPQTTSEQQ